MRSLTLIAAAAVALVSACGGGGGSSEPAGAAAAPAAVVITPTQPPAIAQPIPAASPLPRCEPQVVYLEVFGDSTVDQLSKTGYLQADLIARYGAGAVVFQSRAVGGTTSTMLRTGRDGRNDPWPGSVDADIVVIEGGINEVAPWHPKMGAAEFRSNFEFFAANPNGARLIFMTPNSQVTWAANSPLPQVIRDVAAAHGIPVADADAVVRTWPGWAPQVPDGVHPTTALYQRIASDVLMPALQPLIDPLRCHA